MSGDLQDLERRLGYAFHDRQFLLRSLTHKSRLHQPFADTATCAEDNEQFEFLGDSILGFLVSEWLVREFPEAPEGGLSKRKAHLVSASHLHEVAQSLCLGEFLLLGRGEERSGGREKKALLADALEAVLAALYLDGGIECARQFVERFVLAQASAEMEENGDRDFKTALQEKAQTMKLPPPKYVIVRQSGPEHAKTFTVEVRLGSEWASQAEGSSKKSAGQKAAQILLQQLV
jgi:ribonuclease-3